MGDQCADAVAIGREVASGAQKRDPDESNLVIAQVSGRVAARRQQNRVHCHDETRGNGRHRMTVS
jgi:hypothetical protein